MRGYLMLAGVVLIGSVVVACARSKPAALAPLVTLDQDTNGLMYVAAAPANPAPSAERLALESHPSFMAYVPGFPSAYTRDACLREGWDRPVTVRGPYVEGAYDLLTTDQIEQIKELQSAETKWRAIQEKHGVLPKTP